MCMFRSLASFRQIPVSYRIKNVMRQSHSDFQATKYPRIFHSSGFSLIYTRQCLNLSTSTCSLNQNQQTGGPTGKTSNSPSTGSSADQFVKDEIAPRSPDNLSKLKNKLIATDSKAGASDVAINEDGKKKESRWTGKNAWKLGLVVLGGMGVISICTVFYEWGSPAVDDDGNVIEDEFSKLPALKQYTGRAMKAVRMYNKIIQEPSREKLLPEPLKEPYHQPPYTLVIEMTGVLVNPEWTYGTGWRFKKRPGVEYFLQQVGFPQFEVVIYTAEQGFTAFPILDSLDPNGFIMYRLFRDSTRYIKGHHVKDLDCLNRDLSRVIIIDHNAKSFQLHPRNALHLKRWKGDDADRTLVDLVQFLRTTILSTNIDDVRGVLEYYSQFDDPLEAFKENQRRVLEERELTAKSQAEAAQKKSLTSNYSGFLGRRR